MILTTKKAAYIAKFAEFVWFVWLCSNVQTVQSDINIRMNYFILRLRDLCW